MDLTRSPCWISTNTRGLHLRHLSSPQISIVYTHLRRLIFADRVPTRRHPSHPHSRTPTGAAGWSSPRWIVGCFDRKVVYPCTLTSRLLSFVHIVSRVPSAGFSSVRMPPYSLRGWSRRGLDWILDRTNGRGEERRDLLCELCFRTSCGAWWEGIIKRILI